MMEPVEIFEVITESGPYEVKAFSGKDGKMRYQVEIGRHIITYAGNPL